MPQIWHTPGKSSPDPNRPEACSAENVAILYYLLLCAFRPHFRTAHSAAHLKEPQRRCSRNPGRGRAEFRRCQAGPVAPTRAGRLPAPRAPTRDVRFEERETPKITKPTHAIINISATCVCGSDLWPYRGIQPIDQLAFYAKWPNAFSALPVRETPGGWVCAVPQVSPRVV
jgi:hypothetical protein